jgi:hypothetical protein
MKVNRKSKSFDGIKKIAMRSDNIIAKYINLRRLFFSLLIQLFDKQPYSVVTLRVFH